MSLMSVPKNPYLAFFVLRIFVPVTWFASSLFVTREVVDVGTEFAIGAGILVAWGFMVDFPRGRSSHL